MFLNERWVECLLLSIKLVTRASSRQPPSTHTTVSCNTDIWFIHGRYSWMMVDIATYFEKVEAYICVSNYPVPSTHYLCNSGISKLKHSLYSHQDISSSVYCKQIHLAYDYTWCVHFWPTNKDEWKATNEIFLTLPKRMWTYDIVQVSIWVQVLYIYL